MTTTLARYFRKMFRKARKEGRIPTKMGFRTWVRLSTVTARVSMPHERCPWEHKILAYAKPRGLLPPI